MMRRGVAGFGGRDGNEGTAEERENRCKEYSSFNITT